MALAVETAHSSGRSVAVHATTAEGIRRAVEAGVETIEHGDNVTPEVLRTMATRHIALSCPPSPPREASAIYFQNWHRGEPERQSMQRKRALIRAALDAGVTSRQRQRCGRVHAMADNAREIETSWSTMAHDPHRRTSVRDVDRCHRAPYGHPDRSRGAGSQGRHPLRSPATPRTTSRRFVTSTS